MGNHSRQIESLLRKESWKQARKVIRAELAKDPRSHWLLTRLSMTYYEERRYQLALKFVKKARLIAPECPLAIWDYAGSLDMLGREKAAIALWKKLIIRGERSLASDECGEGLRWAKSLLNDCYYRIGNSYRDIGNERLARSFIRKHLRGRKPGVPSLYEAKRIRQQFPGV